MKVILIEEVDNGGFRVLNELVKNHHERVRKVGKKKIEASVIISSKLDLLTARLFDLSFVALIDELKECSITSTSKVCINKSRIEDIIRIYAPEQAKLLAYAGSSTDYMAHMYLSAFEGFLNALSPYRGDSTALEKNLHIQSVFSREGSANGVGYFLNRPFTQLFPKSAILTKPELKGAGIVFRSAERAAKTSFSKGDSGSVFSLFGIAPIAVLSFVDKDATSGGVTYLPLPRRTETSAEKASVSPEAVSNGGMQPSFMPPVSQPSQPLMPPAGSSAIMDPKKPPASNPGSLKPQAPVSDSARFPAAQPPSSAILAEAPTLIEADDEGSYNFGRNSSGASCQ